MQTMQTVLYGTKSSFVKAVIYTRDLEVFKEMGFVESDHLLTDGTKQDPPPGDDLELQIISSESKDDIEKIIKDLYNVDLDKRGSLDKVKEKALAVINESKRVD